MKPTASEGESYQGSVNLGEVEPNNESLAVACGRAIMAALAGVDGRVAVDGVEGLDGDQIDEMGRYLGRRGVALALDDSGRCNARNVAPIAWR